MNKLTKIERETQNATHLEDADYMVYDICTDFQHFFSSSVNTVMGGTRYTFHLKK